MSNHGYFQAAGKVFGPCTPKELQQLAAEGTIKPSTLVRRGEDGDWFAAGKVKGLFASETADTAKTQSQTMPEAPATLVANRQSMKPLPGWNEQPAQATESLPELQHDSRPQLKSGHWAKVEDDGKPLDSHEVDSPEESDARHNDNRNLSDDRKERKSAERTPMDEARALHAALHLKDRVARKNAMTYISMHVDPNRSMPILCSILTNDPDSDFRAWAGMALHRWAVEKQFEIMLALRVAEDEAALDAAELGFSVNLFNPDGSYANEIYIESNPDWLKARHHVASLVVPSLIKALADPDFWVCANAATALKEFGPDAAPAYSALVRARSRTDDNYARLNWIQRLWERIRYGNDPDKLHRREVDEALSNITHSSRE